MKYQNHEITQNNWDKQDDIKETWGKSQQNEIKLR